jgi:cytochrome c biogenesis protein CcmG, thiol:disulfide interchange protein DsbE
MVCRFWNLDGNGLTRKLFVFILVGLIFGVSLGAAILVSGSTSRPGPEIGTQVDDFSLPGIQAQPIKLSDFRGKAVVLNFWATWCIPCKDEMPLLQKYADSLGSSVVVIGINSQEQAPDVKAYIEANAIRFPIALDLSGEITRRFQINGYPTTFFVDQKGILRGEHIGALREDLLLGYLQGLGVKP